VILDTGEQLFFRICKLKHLCLLDYWLLDGTLLFFVLLHYVSDPSFNDVRVCVTQNDEPINVFFDLPGSVLDYASIWLHSFLDEAIGWRVD